MIKINVGDIFGDYKIISRNKEKDTAAIYWNCECIHCNKPRVIVSSTVRKNPICKCQRAPLLGFVFNDFLVLEKTEQKAKDKCDIYKCQCQNVVILNI